MKMNKKAFTLVELMIVVAIVLILGTAAIIGSGQVLKNLDFGNKFNKVIFMVQKARDLAVNNKNITTGIASVEDYKIEFNLPSAPTEHSVKILAEGKNSTGANASPETIETYTIARTSPFELIVRNASTEASCSNSASISFEIATGQANFTCSGTGSGTPTLLRIGIKRTDTGVEKTFIIHKATGIPQIQ